MKKSIVVLGILSTLLLTACGSNEEEVQDAASNLKKFETEELFIEYPANWELITPKDFTVEVPVGTIVAFRNPIRSEEFTANISIVKYALPTERASIDYAKGLIQKHSRDLLNFEELGRDEIKIKTGIGEFDTLITHFKGKENEQASIKEFLQESVVKLQTVYVVTGAFLLKEDEGVKKIMEQSLNTFEVK